MEEGGEESHSEIKSITSRHASGEQHSSWNWSMGGNRDNEAEMKLIE
jgi:hypothetical protein